MTKTVTKTVTEEEYLALPYRPNVGLMIVNPQGSVFAGQRLDYPSDAWQMPQGGIDKGEEPRTAAYRELFEETGIAPDMVDLLGESRDWYSYDFPQELGRKLWKGRYRGQKQRWFLMRFIGEDSQINIETPEPEFSHWCWMGVNELLGKIVPFKRDIYAQVTSEFDRRFLIG